MKLKIVEKDRAVSGAWIARVEFTGIGEEFSQFFKFQEEPTDAEILEVANDYFKSKMSLPPPSPPEAVQSFTPMLPVPTTFFGRIWFAIAKFFLRWV